MLQENLKKITEIWQQEGVNLAKPLPEKDLVDSFAELRVSLSQDVIEVYSNIGGMINDFMDSVLFTFWTIENIRERNKLNSEFIFFADFLLNSHWYGFKFENENVSSIHIYYSEKNTEKVAGSFDEFFDLYLKNPNEIGLFKE